MGIGLSDLVHNRTMSAEIAATLAGAAEERRSFLVFAIPRLAGKSTVLEAMLAHAGGDTPIRTVTGTAAESARLRAGDGRGYLHIPEISDAPVPGYIWGEPVRRVFALLGRGYALAAALHASGVDEAFDIVCAGNGVPDQDAARLHLTVHIRSIGDWQAPTRRVVEAVHEIHGVTGGRPRLRALHRWSEEADRFVTVNEPRVVLAERWARLARDLGRAGAG
ncbi:MAG: hypothetical protein HYY42_04595 [Chloroflexi bacterium]|nr:hypothetical protein [Chloroflexota bacterium]